MRTGKDRSIFQGLTWYGIKLNFTHNRNPDLNHNHRSELICTRLTLDAIPRLTHLTRI